MITGNPDRRCVIDKVVLISGMQQIKKFLREIGTFKLKKKGRSLVRVTKLAGLNFSLGGDSFVGNHQKSSNVTLKATKPGELIL